MPAAYLSTRKTRKYNPRTKAKEFPPLTADEIESAKRLLARGYAAPTVASLIGRGLNHMMKSLNNNGENNDSKAST